MKEHLISCRVNVMVKDMERSVKFYIDILGMELLNRYGDHYAELQGPDILLALHPTDRAIHGGGQVSIGFGVREFDTVMKELTDKGCSLKLEKGGWIRLAHFQDPDGNPLFLAERKD
jgi:catechol 2,3-dioxygenase-like lactoylglutathione lyase family enzyme